MKEHTHSFLQKAISVALLLLIATVSAFASPTALSTQVLVQNNAQVGAGALTLTLTACDTVNGNSFTATGREIIIAQNTDTSPHAITVTPVADPYGGTNTTLTSYSLPASTVSAIQMKYLIGWSSSGTISMTCTSNLVKFAIVQYN
jgi:hypothetical protein